MPPPTSLLLGAVHGKPVPPPSRRSWEEADMEEGSEDVRRKKRVGDGYYKFFAIFHCHYLLPVDRLEFIKIVSHRLMSFIYIYIRKKIPWRRFQKKFPAVAPIWAIGYNLMAQICFLKKKKEKLPLLPPTAIHAAPVLPHWHPRPLPSPCLCP